jgi:uncharacterized repeat protein (TIGR04076 family)
MSKCKITVVKRTHNQDLVNEYLATKYKERGFGLCNLFEDGQEFVIEGFPGKPEGFCDWAWADIQRDVVTVMFGGDFPWMESDGTAITCCTDGFRPVIFKVERID